MKWKNQMVYHFQVHHYLWQPVVLLFRIIDSHAKLLVEAEIKQTNVLQRTVTFHSWTTFHKDFCL